MCRIKERKKRLSLRERTSFRERERERNERGGKVRKEENSGCGSEKRQKASETKLKKYKTLKL